MKWQAPSEVVVGDIFVATLELNSTTPMRGLPLQLRYAAKQLQLIDIEEGDFFRADGAPTSFTKAIEAQNGTARAGVLRNQATGAQGQGTVVKLRMKALAAGPAEISLASIEPISLGEPIPAVPLPQAFRVTVK